MASNFDCIAKYWPELAQHGYLAELCLYTDANACICKIGTLAERIAQEICSFEKISLPKHAAHADRIRALKYADCLPKRIDGMFYLLRKARNDVVHIGPYGIIMTNGKSLVYQGFLVCHCIFNSFSNLD